MRRRKNTFRDGKESLEFWALYLFFFRLDLSDERNSLGSIALCERTTTHLHSLHFPEEPMYLIPLFRLSQNSIAFCLLQDQYLNEEMKANMGVYLFWIRKNSISFWVIPETFTPEDWSDLEKIIVLTNNFSEFGKRQL